MEILKKPLKIGIIGASRRLFNYYLDILSRAAKRGDIKVVAIYNRTRSNGEKGAEALGCPYFDNLKSVFDDDNIQAVINLLREEIKDHTTLQTLVVGKHIFLETPATHTGIMARRLLDLAGRNNLKVGVAEDFAFFPESQLQRQIISSGILGKPLVVFNDGAGFAYHAMARLGLILSEQDKPISYKFIREKIKQDLSIDFLRIRFQSGINFFQRFPSPKNHFFRRSSQWRILCENGVLTNDEILINSQNQTIERRPFNRQIIDGVVKAINVEIGGKKFAWTLPNDMVGWDYKKYSLAFVFDNFISSLTTGQPVLYDPARAARDILMWRSSRIVSRLNLPISIPAGALAIVERWSSLIKR